MSSLKDIMDVDVEPLQSQAYTRAKEAAPSAPLRSNDISTNSNSPSPSLEDSKGKALSTRRKTNRVSRPGGQSSSSSRTSSIQRRSSAAGEAMDFTSGYQAGGSNQSGSPPQSSSRGSEPATDVPVKYTPVTGRISRAKKGVPVHTCDICRPVKTFTRAEHLRRHQLSHKKPAYPCTFRDCQRAFHRPDLLARHVQRHETQGEKPWRSPGRGQSSSPGPSRGQTPPLKVETPSQPQGESSKANQNNISPTDSDITPRTSAGEESGMTSFTGVGPFQPVNYSPSSTSHKRTAEEAQLPETDPYSAISPGSSQPTSGYGQMQSFGGSSRSAGQGTYGRDAQQNFMFGASGTEFSNFITTQHPQQSLPTLRIPEDGYFPGLSHTQENSPWCSSASDSTYSTQSEGSRSGHWSGQRGRSGSSGPEWPAGIPQFSPHAIMGPSQDLRHPQFDSTMMDQYDSPYSASTPPMSSRHLLDVPSSSFVGYYMEPVNQPTLPTYNKPLAQLFSASTLRESGLGGIDGRQKLEPAQQLRALSLATDIPGYAQESAEQDGYLSSYWKSFNQLFPIVHQATFNPDTNDLLTKAMTAIGTQYHDTVEARQMGMELNEYCKKSIDHFPLWNLQTMQAIILIEVFARFRGRKTTIRLSKHFEELYKRLLNNPGPTHSPFATHAPAPGSNEIRFTSHPSTPPQAINAQDLNREWLAWINTESRQRLLCFCFIFDVYQSIYQEQSRSKAHTEDINPHMYLPCADNLWTASAATQWKLTQNEYNTQVHSLDMIEQDRSGQFAVNRSPFSQILHICSLAARLPTREDRYPNDYHPEDLPSSVTNMSDVFPNSALVHTFLALHYTPLHDLLAIAGDTWVFARKITPPAAFHAAQSRLKTWSSTLAAAAATQHACQYLSSALSQPYRSVAGGQVQTFNTDPFCISNYWALYTSALICWAFGHHRQQSYPSVSRSSSATAINTSDMEIDSPDTPVVDEDRLRALSYINGILELSTEDLLTSKASMRGDTAGVIDSVRLRLEQIGIGGKCMTIVDAIDVLKKLNQGGRARFF